MAEHKLTVDVYASWSDTPPKYRIYVDNELLAERDFIWPGHQVFVRENIIVELPAGEHSIKVEQVGKSGTVKQKDVTLNGVPCLPDFRIL